MGTRRPIFCPELGETPARFGLWLVKPGEAVEPNDRIAEIWIPGAVLDVTTDVASPEVDPVAQPGDLIIPGQILGWVLSEKISTETDVPEEPSSC